MSQKEIARAHFRNVLTKLEVSRRVSFKIYVQEPQVNSLGGINFYSPIEGKVVDQSDGFTTIKVSMSEYTVVQTDLLSQPVEVESKVALSFYKLHRFDGSAADGSEDAAIGGCRTISLTGAKTYFPVKWEGRYVGINEKFEDTYQVIQNPYLRTLIQQMEDMPMADGLRSPVNVLTDANPKDLTFIDPTEEDSALVAPGLRVHVATKKFEGDVTVEYDRGSDTYRVILEADQDDERTVVDNVHFNEVGQCLLECIDDGQWQQAKVTLIKAAPKKRKVAVAA
ncbi:MAG: hypothetical protein Q8S02_16840 [Hydrogenophaga sp.]|nr:hypothetical protein [Hydrogenophaga sp.]